MWNGFRAVTVVMMAAWTLTSCNTAAKDAAGPVPETEQVVSAAIKKLYMDAAAAAPQSAAQQKVILQMAEKASNGKELLLVMRAAAGAFPAGTGSQLHPAESQLGSLVTVKMMGLGTLDQLTEYSTQYNVNAENARPVVERLFRLGDQSTDPRAWYRIRIAAAHLKVADLERQAQVRGDKLAGK